jgi:hypothetical protein
MQAPNQCRPTTAELRTPDSVNRDCSVEQVTHLSRVDHVLSHAKHFTLKRRPTRIGPSRTALECETVEHGLLGD